MDNEKRLLSLLCDALDAKGNATAKQEGAWLRLNQTGEELLERNGILLADMMYDYGDFPEGFVPVCLGMEYYALLPEKLAMRALVLDHLELD